MSAARKILFVKKSGRTSGGHIKFHDYFEHSLRHPDLEPYVFLAYEQANGPGTIWERDVERIVPELDVRLFDLLFIDGRDWELLPLEAEHKRVIHLIQDFRHGDADDPRFAFLSREALRICISPELADRIRPHANGPVVVIPNGIDAKLFAPGAKEPGSVLVWARKDSELGKSIRAALRDRGANVRLLTRPIARDEFARQLAATDVFVGLTKEREGWFLPALEAMASRCAVVCADAIGNRSYCIDRRTCRIARFGDLDDHVRLASELLRDREQVESLQKQALVVARSYTLEREQATFHQVIEEYALQRSAAST